MTQFVKFNIGQNETFKVLATLPASTGSTPLDLTDYTFYGKVRENYKTDEVAAEFTITKVTPYSSGSIIIELENSKTRTLSLKKYVYDIIVESGSFKRKILEGYITVRPQVTRFEYVLPETREYQAQFAISPFLENSSIVLRPDTVSFDYKTSFTLGPTTIGGGAGGFLFEKVWKIRVDDNNVWYSVESGSGWSTEELLFTYSGSPIIEIDAAFEQLGRLNIAAQRNTGAGGTPEVWIYWFDPLENSFVFQNFGSGRTPRISLDDWQTVANSDILVFYVDDTENKIRYRVQRDRFGTVYNTPVTTTTNTYLEKVGFASDYRYRVTYSERDTSTGKYQIKQLATVPYPILKNMYTPESYLVTGSMTSVELKDIILTSSITGSSIDAFYSTGSLVSADVVEIVKSVGMYTTESYYATGSFTSANVIEIVKTASFYNVESYFATGSFVTASVKEIVFTSSLSVESFYTTGSVVSIEVIIP